MLRTPFIPRAGLALVLGTGLVVASIWLLVFELLNPRQERAQRQAEIDSRNLTAVIQPSVSSDFHEIDLLLQSGLDEIYRQRAAGPIVATALDAWLGRLQLRLPQLISLRVTDAQGNVRYGPGVREAPPTNLADRPFFVAHQDDASVGLMIGKPVLARISKQWVLPLSRRVDGPDGSFAGIIYANVPLDWFGRTFSTVDTGPKGLVVLFDRNRTIFTRHPLLGGGYADTAGVTLGTGQVGAMMTEGVTSATFRAAGPDGVVRTHSFKALANNYPLFVGVSLAEDHYLTDWRAQRKVALSLTSAITAVLVVFALLAWRAWTWQASAVAELAAAQEAGNQTLARLRDSDARHRATAARLQLVLRTAAEGIVGIDDDGRVMFANPAAANLLGRDSAEWLLDKPADVALGHRLVDGRPCASHDCRIRITLDDGQVRRVADEAFSGGAGPPIPVEYAVAPLLVEDRISGAVVVFHDIGQRRAIEAELKRSNSDLESFAYVASHDLRQPLRMITSYLTLIERGLAGRMDDDIAHYLGFAIDGAKRMDRLILDLLEYSRIGRHPEANEILNLDHVVAQVLHDLQPAITEAGAAITVPPGLPRVTGNRSELARLFLNLVGNALKYRSPDRPPEIQIGWREDADEWLIWVEDNGIGIAPEDHERAFGVFQRLVAAGSYEGTGIGLALCRKIVEHHQGRIWIRSAVGQGSTFFVSLPKRTSEAVSS